MPPTLQPSLPGARVKVFSPVVSIATALAMLPEETEDDIAAMFDDGRLQWAWNIASLDAPRREARILTACVEALQKKTPFDETLDQVLARILPPAAKGKPWLTLNPQIITAIQCRPTHGMDLLTERGSPLRMVPGTTFRPGPNGSPLITRESFITFLKQRRIQ